MDIIAEGFSHRAACLVFFLAEPLNCWRIESDGFQERGCRLNEAVLGLLSTRSFRLNQFQRMKSGL